MRKNDHKTVHKTYINTLGIELNTLTSGTMTSGAQLSESEWTLKKLVKLFVLQVSPTHYRSLTLVLIHHVPRSRTPCYHCQCHFRNNKFQFYIEIFLFLTQLAIICVFSFINCFPLLIPNELTKYQAT
jgi:hypothetical protein